MKIRISLVWETETGLRVYLWVCTLSETREHSPHENHDHCDPRYCALNLFDHAFDIALMVSYKIVTDGRYEH